MTKDEGREKRALYSDPEQPPQPVDHVGALVEALTPSAATKAAYIGEFSFTIDEQGDGQMCEVSRKVDVPWTVIKQIMAAIQDRARSARDAAIGRRDG